jgi:hypothetical protein
LSLTESQIFGHKSQQRLQITQAFDWFWDKTTSTIRVGVGHLNKFVTFMCSPTLNLKNFEQILRRFDKDGTSLESVLPCNFLVSNKNTAEARACEVEEALTSVNIRV